MNKWPRFALNALGLALSLTGSAYAQLAAVDPGPYTFATGKFPMWYQDNNLLSMELCQSRAASSRVAATTPPAYMCILLAEPGIYDDAQPMIFPDNWPPEAFWFLAETTIADNAAGYGVDAYVAGIEAAFASENPADGDQQSFARIRIRVNVPVAGTYTITHPYGVETVNVTAPGRRAINITRDIGIGAPGNFTGAVNGAIGPFLRSVNGPYTEVNPDTGATETFVGDPNLNEAVTGSPFNTNFLRITGPAGTIQSNVFSLSGKVLDNRQQTQVEIDRATYRRTAAGVRAEVFAKASNSSTLCFRETVALLPGPPPTPCQTSLLGDNNGLFFGHRLGTGAVPPVVVVTATNPAGTTRPTAVSAKLTDVVKVQTARYNWANHSLLIEATSSDEVAIPDMVAQGYGRLSKTGTLQRITVADLTQPPATVTVKSAAGGGDTEAVVVVGSAPDTGENQAPITNADSGSTSFGVPITLSLLTNDSDPDGDNPLGITALTQPAAGQGTVALNGTTSVVYTPPAVVNAPLTTTFTYKAQDAKGLASANPATVTITVAPNQAPTAVADSVATLGVAIPINVLANDTDPEGNVPLAVNSLTQPAAGRGTVSSNGTVITYTPPATVTTAFTTTFTYIARDAFGALSTPATVTVQVSPRPAAETFAVTASTVQARSGGRFNWDFTGTSSVTTGNTITVQVTTPSGLVTLGTTTVPLTGRWRLTLNNTLVVPSANPTATIRSSQGTVRTVSVTTL
ncbi:Ig-like domain-containing protein [Pseudomonas sp. TNT2022 ID642]|uniref:Ig-like domain-containing protein n=1 Tax=Pseudomonas sp. TNT2022 ID642 TaxID=2942632 RepID=UPI00235E9FDF|nr:Ig-like domain-containing protein [Pseudomonas sp. TNT2022 ID642]MDD1005245.1 Ig-like domain-containing protein [Pseudomonas sp. TNT2022 ID642]